MIQRLFSFSILLLLLTHRGHGYTRYRFPSAQAYKSRYSRSSSLRASRRPAGEDIISKIFGAFLPTPESIGLTRFDENSRPENFPAVKDEFADLLPEDKDNDLRIIRPLLAKTNLQFRPLTLAYSGNRDGWTAKAFHEKLDKRGPAVVLCRTKAGAIVGGYNPCGWVNLGENRGSIAAFLFVYPIKGDNGKGSVRPIKLQKISGAGMAQVDGLYSID
jgi:hypothetical protein